MNTKQKGNAGIGAAIAYFTRNGHNVLIPLTDSQDYDLVVDIDGLLNKVQVKYTTQKAPSGNYVVALRSISGSSGKTYKTVAETDIDYLFCVTENNETYLLPSISISNGNSLTITSEFSNKYKV
jgi:hypothetical protein